MLFWALWAVLFAVALGIGVCLAVLQELTDLSLETAKTLQRLYGS